MCSLWKTIEATSSIKYENGNISEKRVDLCFKWVFKLVQVGQKVLGESIATGVLP